MKDAAVLIWGKCYLIEIIPYIVIIVRMSDYKGHDIVLSILECMV